MLFNYIRGQQGIQGPPGPSGAPGLPGSGAGDPELRTDFDNASGIWVKDGINLGLTGSGIFTSKDGSQRLQFKKIKAGSNVTITGDANSLTISSLASSGTGEVNTASNVGSSGLGWFKQKVGSDLEFKKVVAGDNISLVLSADSIRIVGISPGETNTASNIGSGVGVFDSKVGVDLRFKRILGGSGVEVRASGQTIILDNELVDDFIILNSQVASHYLDFVNSSGVFLKTGSNLGSGSQVFKQRIGSDLEFRTLVAGSGMQFTVGSSTIIIDNKLQDDVDILYTRSDSIRTDFTNSSGVWIKTASNIGASGGGLFKQKVGSDLQFKKLVADGAITFIESSDSIRITTPANSGEANTASNMGEGQGIFDSKVGVDLRFKKLLGGSGIEITASGQTLILDNELSDDVSLLYTRNDSIRADFDNASGVWVKTASNVGAGSSLFKQKVGSNLEFKTLTAGSGVQLTSNTNDVLIDITIVDDLILTDARVTQLRTDFTNSSGVFQTGVTKTNQLRIDFDNASGVYIKGAMNQGMGSGVFFIEDGDKKLIFKTLVPGMNVTILGDDDQLVISAVAPSGSGQAGEANDAANIGTGVGVFAIKSGVTLNFRKLLSGSGIKVAASGNSIIINNCLSDDFVILNGQHNQLRTDFSNASGLWVKTASNIGSSGVGLFKQKIASDLQFKKIVAGNNVTFIESADSIRISTPTPTGEANTASNVGQGEGVFESKVGVDLRFKKLLGGSGIEVSTSGQTIRIDNELSDDVNILYGLNSDIRTDFTNSSGVFQAGTNKANEVRIDFDNASGVWVKDGLNLGTGSGLFVVKDANKKLDFKSLKAGSNVQLIGDGTSITISATDTNTGEANTASNVGLGEGIFSTKVGVDLRFKSLLGGSGIEVRASGSTIIFDNELSDDFIELSIEHDNLRTDFDNSSGVFVKTASNVGSSGVGMFKQKSGSDLQFKQLVAGTNVTLIQSLDSVRINTPIEDNTASNVGLGEGVFDSKVGLDLRFKKLLGGSGIEVRSSGTTIILDNELSDDVDIIYGQANEIRTDFDNASGVWVKDGTNLGAGKNIFKQKNASKSLEFRSITAGSGIQLTESATEVRVDNTFVDDFGILQTSSAKIRTDFTNSSGMYYKRNATMVPLSNNAFDVGTSAARMKDIYAASGNFNNGLGRNANWHITPSGRAIFRTSSAPFIQLTSAATINIDFNRGYNFRIQLGHSPTFVFHNPLDGERYLFHVKQALSGSHNITWPANVLWPSGTDPIVTASGGITAGHKVRDIYTLLFDKTDNVYFGGYSKDLF